MWTVCLTCYCSEGEKQQKQPFTAEIVTETQSPDFHKDFKRANTMLSFFPCWDPHVALMTRMLQMHSFFVLLVISEESLTSSENSLDTCTVVCVVTVIVHYLKCMRLSLFSVDIIYYWHARWPPRPPNYHPADILNTALNPSLMWQ